MTFSIKFFHSWSTNRSVHLIIDPGYDLGVFLKIAIFYQYVSIEISTVLIHLAMHPPLEIYTKGGSLGVADLLLPEGSSLSSQRPKGSIPRVDSKSASKDSELL